MNLKKVFFVVLLLTICALSIEILWRRLVVGQIPTQFSGFFVYALLLGNTVYLCNEAFRLFKARK